MTVNNSPLAGASKNRHPDARKPILPQPFLIGTLIVLVAVAIYLWSRPLLRERQLSHATLSELEAMAKQKDDPRVLYYLGLRQREKGDLKAAFDTFSQAAKFTDSDTQIWLAVADSGKAVEGDQTAFNVLGMFVKNNPNNPSGHLAMARLYLDHRSWRRAREEANLAAANDGKLGEAWRIVGISELALELAKQAEPALRRAVALDPTDWQSQTALGDGLAAQNRFKESIPIYQEAVRLAPNEPVPALSLGRAILKEDPANVTPEQLAAAEQSLQRSIQLRGDIPVAYVLLGQCLAQQKRLGEARTALEHGRDLAPADPDAYFELARVATKMGDAAGAARYRAQHTEVLHRRNAFGDRQRSLRARIANALSAGQESQADGLRRELARVLADGGKKDGALQEYGILLTHYPTDTALQQEASAVRRQIAEAALAQQSLPSLLTQGDTLLAQKQFSGAAAAYKNALKRDPKSSRAAEGLGLTLQAAGRAEEATYYLLAATHLDAKLPRAEFALAVRYKEIGFLTQAAERLRKVVELEPENGAAWDELGQVLRDRDGSEADAEFAFQRAVDQEPANVAFLVDLADIQDTNNKKMQAETAFRRAVALDPHSAETVASLGAFLVNNPTNAARREEAAGLLDRALMLDTNDDFARYYQGKLALEKGDAARAVTLLEAVLKKGENAKNREIWYSLGRAYIRKGDRAQGEKALAISHKMEADDVAYAQAREQLSLHPNDPARHLTLARAFVRRGENARAIQEYERTLRLDAKNAVVLRELAALKTRLQAEGAMPSMSLYDALVSAADTRKRSDESKLSLPPVRSSR